ncbi:MAG: NAD-dependent epimerase/dehydratase family protein [Planctomycetota bacterium]
MLDAHRRQYGFNGVYLIPVNLYGPGDNFDPRTSHVVPAMIRRFCEAIDTGRNEVTCWGTGKASRELLYVDDAAEAIVQALSTQRLRADQPRNGTRDHDRAVGRDDRRLLRFSRSDRLRRASDRRSTSPLSRYVARRAAAGVADGNDARRGPATDYRVVAQPRTDKPRPSDQSSAIILPPALKCGGFHNPLQSPSFFRLAAAARRS